MKNKNNRFVYGDRQGKMKVTQIITDTKTGVQYLYVSEGYSGGLTVLVDRDGRPLLNESAMYLGR